MITIFKNLITLIKVQALNLFGNPSKNPASDEYKFKDLTPTDKADNDGEYSKALWQALQNNKVANIAITGPYGSGKSSVLRTFESKFKDKDGFKFLNITLGSFNDEINTGTKDLKTNEQNNLIEKSLLQQIIYKVEGKVLPDSKLTRVNLTDWKTNLSLSAFLLIWSLSLFYSLKPAHKFFEIFSITQKLNLGVIKIFALLGALLLIQTVLNVLNKSSLTKIGFASTEISFNENKGDSILNKYLDEILYFFSKTNFNVVIIEDLDRFNEVGIFIKLREINTLLNNSDRIKKRKRPIKFIYAIRDDVFRDVSRTKFFDFIVPIIPIINASNSAEKLILELKIAFPKHNISSDFLNDVTLFIDDMRLLRNITNEFVIYKNKLRAVSGFELRDDKLLSLIIYKNKFPEDFSKLNYQEGNIAELFKKKSMLQTSTINALKKQIESYEEELEAIENQLPKSLEELRTLYLGKIFQELPASSNILIGGSVRTFAESLSEEVFNQLRSQASAIQYNLNGYPRSTAKTFANIENALDAKLSFSDREKLTTNRLNGKIKSLKTKIEETNKEIRSIQSLKLKNLIENYSPHDFFRFEDKKNDLQDSDLSLIRFLVTNGYLDEDYESYISFFYEGELSKNDKQFLIGVKSHETLEFEHKLSNKLEVKNRLSLVQFSTRTILNLDLFEYLLAENCDKSILDNAFDAIASNPNAGRSFITEYLSTRSFIPKFIENLTKAWPLCWSELIIGGQYFESESQQLILEKLIQHASIDTLKGINEISSFHNFLCEFFDVFSVFAKIDKSKIEAVIVALNLKFEDIINVENESLLEFIGKNWAYEINAVNINCLLAPTLQLHDENNNLIVNYASIVNSNKKYILEYVDKNINEYVANVLIPFGSPDKEDEHSAATLLKHDDLLIDHAIKIISAFSFKINRISVLEDNSLWAKIVSESKMVANWENVLEYFKLIDKKFDDNLIRFFNVQENYQLLSNKRLETGQDGLDISREILFCDEISDESYDLLIKSIPYWYKEIDDISISDTKLHSLLNRDKLGLTVKNFDLVKDQLGDQCVTLIEKNIKVFLSEMESFDLDNHCYEKILDSKVLETEVKIKIAQSIKEENLEEDEKLSTQLAIFIISNDGMQVSKNVFDALLKNDIGIENKTDLFNRHSTIIKNEDIVELVEMIGSPISGLVINKRPSIPASDSNLTFSKFLEGKGFIKVTPTSNALKLYPKRKIVK